jgi:hypothetical protein
MHRLELLPRPRLCYLEIPAADVRQSAASFADDKPRRVGLIGTGWYGKSDLLRLIQVAPVEVVSLCDVDSQMLARGRHRGHPAGSRKRSRAPMPTTAKCWREGSRHRRGRHARSLACAADDRGRRSPARTSTCRSPSAWISRRPGHARGGAQVQPRGPGGHAAPQHAAPDRSPRPLHQGRRWARSRWSKSIATTTCAPPTNPPDTARPPISITRCGPAPRPCAPTTRWCIRAAGARSWSTATASSATCASTCSTWFAG